ncbi:MAG TPA: sigma-70 family RNA polymerase sigma factor [Kofleriaceae bacterium]|nr:sigma-70 family RNA polymerase sigma factor [Kofleriaceae bacterium]
MFPMTRPSAVADLLSGDPARHARSLDVVVRAYWKPVYKYLRLKWTVDAEAARDLTQSFFETAIGRDSLAAYDPQRGRFRSFLRACLDRHVIDQHRRASAARRGGKEIHLDFATAEAELAASSAQADPAAIFDAEWLRHLMQLALERLDAHFGDKKPIHARLFREFHTGDAAPTYAEAAARHGISTADVTNWLHAARREFRRVALELLRELTLDEEDFAAEARAVFGIDSARDGDR